MSNIPTLSSLNFIDFLIIFLFLRILLVSYKEGILTETFKSISILGGFIVGVQASPILATKIMGKLPFSVEGMESFIFLVIVIGIFIVLSLVRKGIQLGIKSKEFSSLSRFFAVLMGGVRSIFTAIIIICLFLFSENKYLQSLAQNAYFYTPLANIGKTTYQVVYKKFIVKLYPNVSFNKKMEEL